MRSLSHARPHRSQPSWPSTTSPLFSLVLLCLVVRTHGQCRRRRLDITSFFYFFFVWHCRRRQEVAVVVKKKIVGNPFLGSLCKVSQATLVCFFVSFGTTNGGRRQSKRRAKRLPTAGQSRGGKRTATALSTVGQSNPSAKDFFACTQRGQQQETLERAPKDQIKNEEKKEKMEPDVTRGTKNLPPRDSMRSGVVRPVGFFPKQIKLCTKKSG
ncbi:hypothetical protein TW95_gp0987 [Pandoravirus inopinatum]|uniref:Uncharacterized protein n=1 Tax=Pandoravirus inopinatum TaxID=1605721 RepID=A0A0B5JA21_9VIRU|nr:hypothetical protein TW95_gp0987 [Pandoravirus inopinatum]AJF97721.1 hypothetical protein [Pandoravirus inopinatum]